MKKSLILVMFLLMAALVSAEDVVEGPVIFDLAEFSEEPVQAVRVEKGDQMMFNMFDQRHGLFIRDLIKDNVKLVFFPNKVEGQSSKGAGSMPLKEGRALMIDVNKDDKDDLLVRLYSINPESAVLILSDIRNDRETPVPTGSGVVPTGLGGKNTDRSVFFVLGFIVVVLIVILAVKKYGKKDENDGYLEVKPESNSEERFESFQNGLE